MQLLTFFSKEVPGFSKYKLAKEYIKWTRGKTIKDLRAGEVSQWAALISAINKALK